MHRVAVGQHARHNGVASLMIRGYPLILGRYNMAALFGADHGASYGLLKLRHAYFLFLIPCGKYGGLVQHVFKIRTREARRALCKHRKAYLIGQRLALGMHLQYGLASLNVGVIYGYLPIKPARAQKRGVKYIRAVGGGDNYYAFVLNKELVERLLAFVMPAAKARAALTAHGVYFVYKHNGGRALLCGGEKIPHPACANAYEHFNKVRTGY